MFYFYICFEFTGILGDLLPERRRVVSGTASGGFIKVNRERDEKISLFGSEKSRIRSSLVAGKGTISKEGITYGK